MGPTREELIRADLDALGTSMPKLLRDYPSVLAEFADLQRRHDALRPEVSADRFLVSWQHNSAWRRLGAARYADFYTATRALDMAGWHPFSEVLFIGLGDAVEHDDFSALTAAVDSYARLHVVDSLHSHSDLDHSFQFLVMLEAFATRDLALVNEISRAPRDLAPTTTRSTSSARTWRGRYCMGRRSSAVGRSRAPRNTSRPRATL